jgi:hypothetical protein
MSGLSNGVAAAQSDGVEKRCRLPGRLAAGRHQLDGARAAVVMSKEGGRPGVGWLAEVGACGAVAGSNRSLLLQPAYAIREGSAATGSFM